MTHLSRLLFAVPLALGLAKASGLEDAIGICKEIQDKISKASDVVFPSTPTLATTPEPTTEALTFSRFSPGYSLQRRAEALVPVVKGQACMCRQGGLRPGRLGSAPDCRTFPYPVCHLLGRTYFQPWLLQHQGGAHLT